MRSMRVASVGMIALAACTHEEASPTSTELGSKLPRPALLQPDATGPAPDPSGARKGGTIILKTGNALDNPDPSTQNSDAAQAMLRLTTRTLTQYKVERAIPVLVPDMATNLGKRSKDGLAWTYTLKKGLKFEDGTPIKASDVAYSVKRSFATEEMPAGPTFQIEYLQGGTKYKGPWKDGDDYEGISHDDDKGTITFQLARKMESFPSIASLTMFGAIPKEKDTKLEYQKRWMSTGPYKIKSHTTGSRLILVRNEHWDAKSDPARNRFPDSFDIRFGQPENSTAQAILADQGSNQRTLFWDAGDLHAALVRHTTSPKSDRVETGPSPCTSWGTTIDTTRVPLAVRRAIVMAWPTDAIQKASREWHPSLYHGGTLAPPQLPAFLKYALPDGKNGKGPGNPKKARAMLKKAEKLGFELSYYYVNDTKESRKAEQAKKPALEKAGFTVKSIGVPSADYRGKRNDPKAPTNLGNGVTGWCYDWLSGDAVYPLLFKSTLGRNAGVGNVKDKKLDADMRRISEMPLNEQAPEWSKLDKRIMSEVIPVVQTFDTRAAAVFGTKVGGVVIDAHQGTPYLTDLYLK